MKELTKTESQFGLQVVGWLGGESFLKSNLSVNNVLVGKEKETDKLKVEIRWSRRLNGGVNGMVLIQKENNEYDMLLTNFGRHDKDKKSKPKSKVVKRYTKVIQRQVPSLFEEATGFNIDALKS
tara:strand:- start:145718 stop:146089 length:372 start_codon:yes stop_codon:yes gene_type:complete